ncbi:hypothetical protein V3C99_004567 [Haemonchus contortus]
MHAFERMGRSYYPYSGPWKEGNSCGQSGYDLCSNYAASKGGTTEFLDAKSLLCREEVDPVAPPPHDNGPATLSMICTTDLRLMTTIFVLDWLRSLRESTQINNEI